MILKRVHLFPFAGQVDRAINFTPGLNVICGPNEVGKSTIFYAIQQVLFVSAHIGVRDFQREIERFIPIGGGDTITVELEFEHDGACYILRRMWGATQSEELKLPGGNIVTDGEAIDEQLKIVLPVNEGTCRSVLMAYQAGLTQTLKDLREHPDAMQTLGMVLRRAVYETDDVSVEQFRAKIEERFVQYFSRWNRTDREPETRGRRFQREVGEILRAFYDWEDLQQELDNVHGYEDELMRLNNLIAECGGQVIEDEQFVQENQIIVDDAGERQLLASRLRELDVEIKDLKQANNDWPVAELQTRELRGQLPQLEEKRVALEEEERSVREWSEKKEKYEQFLRVQKIKNQLDEMRERQAETPGVTSQEIAELQGLDVQFRELKASIGASQLSLKITAKNEMAVVIQEDMGECREEELESDGILQVQAENRLQIEHPDWKIELVSGEGNAEEIIRQCDQLHELLQQKFAELKVQNLEEANNLHVKYDRACREVEQLESRMNEELDNETWDTLSVQGAEACVRTSDRPLDGIVIELAEVRREIERREEKLDEEEARLAELKDKYDDQDQLINTLAKYTIQRSEVDTQFDALVPLPEGVEDLDEFVTEFKRRRIKLEENKEQINELKLSRAEHQRNEPEFSVEEMERRVVEAEERYERVLYQGEAIGRIYDVTQTLIEEMDADTFEGLETDMIRNVSAMTEGRYSAVDIEEGLPRGFIRQDGAVLPYDRLSAGTKDIFGLSLRLAMASHFLEGAGGFFMLDDPLVELDPRRQENGAQLVADFAKEKQTLLFTCHPNHADMLEGNRIDLGSP
jgi:DNA repair protein SbcC/Rad50